MENQTQQADQQFISFDQDARTVTLGDLVQIRVLPTGALEIDGLDKLASAPSGYCGIADIAMLVQRELTFERPSNFLAQTALAYVARLIRSVSQDLHVFYYHFLWLPTVRHLVPGEWNKLVKLQPAVTAILSECPRMASLFALLARNDYELAVIPPEQALAGLRATWLNQGLEAANWQWIRELAPPQIQTLAKHLRLPESRSAVFRAINIVAGSGLPQGRRLKDWLPRLASGEFPESAVIQAVQSLKSSKIC